MSSPPPSPYVPDFDDLPSFDPGMGAAVPPTGPESHALQGPAPEGVGAAPVLPLALDWSAYDAYGAGDAYAQLPRHGEGFGKASAVCIGSRTCQRTDAKGVMCPSFRVTGQTEHSTQHRAATLKALLDGELGERPFSRPELDAAMDLCVSCKGCKRECPNGVDMALLRTEVLAQRWTEQAMPRRERLFAHLPAVLHRLRRWPGARRLTALRPAHSRVARWIESRFGLAASRSLPAMAPRTFLDRAGRTAPLFSGVAVGVPSSGPLSTDALRSEAVPACAVSADAPSASALGRTRTRRDVVLLVDTFHNQFHPETLEAAVEVLEAIGCRVHLARPPEGEAPLCCGRTALSGGLVGVARAHASRLIEVLQPHIDAGHPVLGLEPSCLLMLRDEYLALGLGEPAKKLAKQALLLEEFLAKEADVKDDPKKLQLKLGALCPAPQTAENTEVHALVHGHCHQKAFGAMKAMRKVLGWVPGLKVEFIESSCCGMAGSFGLEAEHQHVSMQMGELTLLPAVRAAAPDTWVLANGTSCRHQIRDGAQREAQHFVHLLHASLKATPAAGPAASTAKGGPP